MSHIWGPLPTRPVTPSWRNCLPSTDSSSRFEPRNNSCHPTLLWLVLAGAPGLDMLSVVPGTWCFLQQQWLSERLGRSPDRSRQVNKKRGYYWGQGALRRHQGSETPLNIGRAAKDCLRTAWQSVRREIRGEWRDWLSHIGECSAKWHCLMWLGSGDDHGPWWVWVGHWDCICFWN